MTSRTQLDTSVLSDWVRLYGEFPDDYVCVDLESTGITERDKIVQIGWCLVRGRKPILTGSVVLDWTDDADTDQKWLAETINRTRKKMADKGKQYPWTIDLLKKSPYTPKGAVEKFVEVCNGYAAYSAHYGWAFDYPRLGSLMASFGVDFAPDTAKMYDTGMLTKACLVSIRPRDGESVPSYMKRINSARSAPRHNIETCVELYGLRAAGAATKNAHEGGYDAWLVALMTEKMRHLESSGRV